MGNHIKTFQEKREDAAYKSLDHTGDLYEVTEENIKRKRDDHIENYYEYVDKEKRL